MTKRKAAKAKKRAFRLKRETNMERRNCISHPRQSRYLAKRQQRQTLLLT